MRNSEKTARLMVIVILSVSVGIIGAITTIQLSHHLESLLLITILLSIISYNIIKLTLEHEEAPE